MAMITEVYAREILDSRGNPTVVVRAVGHDGRHTVCIVESTDEVV